MHSPLLATSLALVVLAGCSSTRSNEPTTGEEAFLGGNGDPDILTIDTLGPEATVHLTLPGRVDCGFRVALSEHATVGWNFFNLPNIVAVGGPASTLDLDVEHKSLDVVLTHPSPGWDIWMTIQTRDGSSLADLIRSVANVPPGASLGTIAPTRCPAAPQR